jgi:hypothetical protein
LFICYVLSPNSFCPNFCSFFWAWIPHAKEKIELFKLFAKVLLALRPFAMCLKMLMFFSSVEDSFLLYFFECGVVLMVATNGLQLPEGREFENESNLKYRSLKQLESFIRRRKPAFWVGAVSGSAALKDY